MANNTYPSDARKPVQTLTFLYKGGGIIYFYLHPQPDAQHERVATVEVTYEMPGWPTVIETPSEQRSVMEAGVLAFNQAQTEGQVNGKTIQEVWLDGNEFLTKADLEDITGRAFPVVAK
ncbi:hypothetical protein [Cupriavidus sp. a3]|uniref:hypothetical protein n=1 Tax=Cupriavidus sp. a3 TaxID=3242158 RepID=UPI003D9C3A8B